MFVVFYYLAGESAIVPSKRRGYNEIFDPDEEQGTGTICGSHLHTRKVDGKDGTLRWSAEVKDKAKSTSKKVVASKK